LEAAMPKKGPPMTTQCPHTLSVRCLSDAGHEGVLHQNGASTWTGDAPSAPLDLDAVRALCEAVTPGPWTATFEDHDGDPSPSGSIVSPPMTGRGFELDGCLEILADDVKRADATFIAASRTLVPQLIAEVERLREEVADAAKKAGE